MAEPKLGIDRRIDRIEAAVMKLAKLSAPKYRDNMLEEIQKILDGNDEENDGEDGSESRKPSSPPENPFK